MRKNRDMYGFSSPSWVLNTMAPRSRVFTENSVGLDFLFLVVCFLYETNPNPRKNICLCEKVVQTPLFNLIFLGVGWPWVGEFDGFIILLVCFPTEQNLVYRRHPINSVPLV